MRSLVSTVAAARSCGCVRQRLSVATRDYLDPKILAVISLALLTGIQVNEFWQEAKKACKSLRVWYADRRDLDTGAANPPCFVSMCVIFSVQ